MMELPDLTPLWLTFKLATATTAVLMVLGPPLAWWLARTRCRLRAPVEALVALPLVLPPTVLGFYLLLALGPDGIIGGPWRDAGGGPLVFTFPGLVIGSVLYSLPFVVQPLLNTFGGVGESLLEAAGTLRAGPLDRFFNVVLPLSGRGLITAATLGFAHTVGEFGVILMIGGNIPGETQVIAIAIYDHVEALEYAQAHTLSAGLVVLAFAVLFVVYGLNRPGRGERA